ncbi:MAG: hypothetical protein EXR76_05250 [Myxococcales bacterium]|nr:hypothetical protein [Myxococcales bacterium]
MHAEPQRVDTGERGLEGCSRPEHRGGEPIDDVDADVRFDEEGLTHLGVGVETKGHVSRARHRAAGQIGELPLIGERDFTAGLRLGRARGGGKDEADEQQELGADVHRERRPSK